MNKFYKIEKCRVCGNEHLVTVLDLGDQYLSGIFPKEIDEDMYKGPLALVKCDEKKGGCGHVQLEHTFDLPTMYGDEYGYHSGLNGSMIRTFVRRQSRSWQIPILTLVISLLILLVTMAPSSDASS